MLFEQGGCLVCSAAVEQAAVRRYQLTPLFVPVGGTQIELLDHCGGVLAVQGAGEQLTKQLM